MDLSALANPYDFSHPVSDPELFFGRTKERGEIGYYLDQAGKTRRPVSLAILGDRAAGKTSLLNLIETEGERKKLFPVRIDLDETDVEDELRFFHKILNALLTKAFEAGYFGGKSGKAFAVYLDMTSAYVLPNSLEFAPWTFPLQYARARANDRKGVALDDPAFKEDLRKLSSEISATILLIFDERNVFKKDHFLLQKIRNIFMNLPGYMLVFSGTKDLFPIMDEIFSPIIRQFKKIELGAFTRFSDTQQCVEVPLVSAGLPQKEIAKLLSNGEIVDDIHKLSAGRPYEIQLICHMLMRRCQMGLTKKFLLNINVLEEIRSELATGQDMTDRPIIVAAKGLQKGSLEALGTLCSCEERIKFDQIWGEEWTVRGETRWTKASLEQQKNLLASLGILEEIHGYLRFRGDQFDRIYLKYVSRQKQVTFSVWNLPSELLIWHRFERALSSRWKFSNVTSKVSPTNSFEDTAGVVKAATEANFDDTFFASTMGEELVTNLLSPWSYENLVLIDARLQADDRCSQCWGVWPLVSEGKLERLLEELNDMSARASDIGWSLTFQHFILKHCDEMALTSALKALGNDVFNARLAASLGSSLHTAYVTLRNRDLAKTYVDCILALDEKPNASISNNIGYLALSRQDFDIAEQFFNLALQQIEENSRMLVAYNLGICSMLQKKFAEALGYFRAANAEPIDDGASCVFVIETSEDGDLFTKEIFNVDDLRPHIEAGIKYCQLGVPA